MNELRSARGRIRSSFFCPILMVEEEAELCRGHVLPRAVGGDRWVVQRKDVDNFYGTFANADFVHGLKLRTSDPNEMLQHVRKHKLRGRIRVESPQFPPGRHRIDDLIPGVVDGDYDVRLRFDIEYQTLLSCIHTAHLGHFREMGYRYVASKTGGFLADLLRTVYEHYSRPERRTHRRLVKKDPSELARICLPYQNLVRPLSGSESLYDKLLDEPFRWFAVAWDGDVMFATIDFLRSGGEVNAVMLPMSFDERSAAIVCSSVPISFEVGLARLDGGSVQVASAHDTRWTWTCGDKSAGKPVVPIAEAARKMRRDMRSW